MKATSFTLSACHGLLVGESVEIARSLSFEKLPRRTCRQTTSSISKDASCLFSKALADSICKKHCFRSG